MEFFFKFLKKKQIKDVMSHVNDANVENFLPMPGYFWQLHLVHAKNWRTFNTYRIIGFAEIRLKIYVIRYKC